MRNVTKKMPTKKMTKESSEEEIDESLMGSEGDLSLEKDITEDDDDEMVENEGESSLEEDGYEGDEGEDDIVEELEEQSSKKRKYDKEDESTSSNKSKRRKNNVKPPTAEEMMNLRETENLFHSSLFRLQIAEMLSELKPKKNVKRFVGSWTEKLKTFLMNLDASDSYALSDTNWLEELQICFPLKNKPPQEGKGIFKFQPPVDVFAIGSHAFGCPLTPSHSVDIAVVIPKNFILHDDNLNQRYYIKRALYLCYIAGKLREDSDLLSSDHKIEFIHFSGDPFKPILILHPAGKISLLTVRLFPVLEENSFKFKRLLPSKNNVRSDWWGLKKDFLPPTPLYNANIVEDLVFIQNHALKKEMFDQNQNVKDAFILLRVWLKQRGLNQSYGSFTSHITAMLLVYLMKCRKINKFMSSYQIIRQFWLYLADCDWTEDGPTICEAKIEGAPEKDEFHMYHDIVFVDVSGYFNLAARLNKFIYLQVKEESKLAIQHLDNQAVNGFDVLFMTKMPFIRQYDIVLWFDNTEEMRLVVDTHGDAVNLMDLNDEVAPEFIRLVAEVLEKGIGHRLSSIGIQFPETYCWDVSTSHNNIGCVKLGLNLNASTALSLIDKGPEANAPGAEEFREFWKGKCDLRRFKDGTVCESVVWAGSNTTIEERRAIINDIISYLLSSKLSIPVVQNTSKFFQSIEKHKMFKLKLQKLEETSSKIHLAYEDLSRQLRDLPDLPLSIVSVHCISPVYRFTDPFPPFKPFKKPAEDIASFINDPVKGILFSDSGKIGKSPQYIAPIDCVVQMALSSRWPQDIHAQRLLITSFNDAITKALKKHCNLCCRISRDCFIVNKDGYLFRVFLGNNNEIGLLKLQISKEGVRQYRDTPESLNLEKKFINLPKITGGLYRLSEEHPGFSSATRLAKRWFCSQLLDDNHFPQVLIELLMAHVFLAPQPYKNCLGTLPGFLRFLSFISTTDWSIFPVIVNFNSLLTSDDIQEIEKTFREERSSFPPLFLATPYDRSGSLWSRSTPTLPTLVRLGQLAKASLQILEAHIFDYRKLDNISNIFRPPMSVYDAVISLRNVFQLRASERFFNSECAKYLTNTKCVKRPILPILDFNPVDLYLKNLRDSFGQDVLFFHDTFGGTEIGVLFKPTFFENIRRQNAILSEKKGNEDMILNLKQHLDYIFHNFTILGNGIVDKIELRRLKVEDEASVSHSYYAS